MRAPNIDPSPSPRPRWPAWIDGTSAAEPEVQTWAYDGATTFFRQSLKTHFEAPFVQLLIGKERALLVDTGTGHADLRTAVDRVLADYDVDLVVAHTHTHDDHVGGDALFAGRARTTIVGHSVGEVRHAFGIDREQGGIDLGGRVLDVLAIPGHEPAHIAFYDRGSRLFLSGDTLYPGRLYVRDWGAFRASVARMVDFVDAGNPLGDVIGSHIEMAADQVEFEDKVLTHPNEHPLPLSEEHLRDLLVTVNRLADAPVRTVRPSYVVVPLFDTAF